jgi:NAD(P)H-hydrate epimerase
LYIVTTQQMQAAEKAANAAGLSYEQMMENAGRVIAEAIEARFGAAGRRVLVLAGPGNNGGDGLVIARHLARMGSVVTIYAWKRNTDGDKNWALLDQTSVERVKAEDHGAQARLAQLLEEAAIIVDALLGTGVSRPIEGSLAELLQQAKSVITARRIPHAGQTRLIDPARPTLKAEFGPVVVAVDVPSGLNSDTGAVDPHTLAADLTVTLAAVKRGHILPPGVDVVGRLMVGDIGLTAGHYPAGASLELATAAKAAALLPARPASAHKGTFGTALLVAGSKNYTGAAILSGQSAVRIGAGLVNIAAPAASYRVVVSRVPEAIYTPLPDEDGYIAPTAIKPLTEAFERANALLVGPGLSQAAPTTAFLKNLLAGRDLLPPLIADADALNILAKEKDWHRLLPTQSIITPHPGEMSRLMNTTISEVQANRLETAGQMAAQWQQVVLLKGAHTVIAAPDGRVMVMPFANPALAKAGSGDVLAGAIVGLRAQGLDSFEAAVAGAYLHGLAGELVREHLGSASAAAGDLVSYLPAAVRALQGEGR